MSGISLELVIIVVFIDLQFRHNRTANFILGSGLDLMGSHSLSYNHIGTVHLPSSLLPCPKLSNSPSLMNHDLTIIALMCNCYCDQFNASMAGQFA